MVRFSERHCIGATDVNFPFPFGWLFITGLSSVIAKRFLTPAIVGYGLAGLLVGNVMEFVFYKANGGHTITTQNRSATLGRSPQKSP